MRARVCAALGAALLGVTAHAGCRALDGLDGLQFDLVPDGGAGGGPSCALPGDDCNARPPGWAGPVAIYEGAPATVPTCPDGYAEQAAQGQRGVSAPPAACAACACGTPALTCSPGALGIHANSSCHGTTSTRTLADGVCAPVQGTGVSFDEAAPQVTGTCDPSGGAPSLSPPAWATAGVACAPTTPPVSCADGSLCAPLPPAPFERRWCIWQAGAVVCPARFPVQHAWQDAQDQRGCSPCACGSPAPASCVVKTVLYTDGNCQNQPTTVGGAGQCIDATNIQSALADVSFSGPSSCKASGGSPVGSVVATTVVTVCCPP